MPHEFWGLPRGERVVEHIPVDTGNVKDYFGTLHELIVYAAGDGPPRKLWSIPCSLLGARPLPNGQILVWTDEFVRRYDRTGSKLWETEIVWKGQTRLPLGAEPLANGNLRVLFRTGKTGKVIWSYTNDTIVITAQRLPNGDTLIGAIGQAKAIDMNGNVTWKPDDSLFMYKTAGYEAHRYYSVLAP